MIAIDTSPAALIAIIGATFVSEDLTTVGVGLAVRDGALRFGPALIACAIGILLGDVSLWMAGRLGGRRVLAWRVMQRLPLDSARALGTWVDRHPAAAMIGSRCLPGTRVPMYLAAGIWSERPWRVLGWMCVAVALWTPLLLIATMVFGAAVGSLFVGATGGGAWIARVMAGVATIGLLHLVANLVTMDGRERIGVRVARLRRWEFWPAWIVNAPIAIWIALLAIRHRSLTVFTAANPGIADGGVVGESKSAILASLPQAWVMPWAAIAPDDLDTRIARVRANVAARGWQFPLVIKPDQGERGVGVRWVQHLEDVRRYLAREPRTVVLQVPHDGPFEAGLFYVRHPGEARGRLFSITDKRFPILIGDGHSTIGALIRAHPRFRLQARVFLARHAAQADRVPAAGETVALAKAGNHAQGTEFRDGSMLWTPALEARIDAIARRLDGFYFGRFDVRYQDRRAFMEGHDLAIIELNGVTSEATHIYDPSRSIVAAWHTLMQQWSLAFAIGAANRARGHHPATLRRLASLVWIHLRATPAHPLAD